MANNLSCYHSEAQESPCNQQTYDSIRNQRSLGVITLHQTCQENFTTRCFEIKDSNAVSVVYLKSSIPVLPSYKAFLTMLEAKPKACENRHDDTHHHEHLTAEENIPFAQRKSYLNIWKR